MAKYLYTTVYEQFTGQKPPEPEPKPEHRQRKTHGHPYRMRHNLQTQREQQDGELHNSYESNEHQQDDQQPLNNNAKPGYHSRGTGHPFRQNRVRQQANYNSQQSQTSYEAGENKPRYNNNQASPKVTYKKRRQYRSPQDSKHQYDV